MVGDSNSFPERTDRFGFWLDLPEDLQIYILQFFTLTDHLQLSYVNKEFCRLARSDVLWRAAFQSRFTAAEAAATVEIPQSNVHESYVRRLHVPELGDLVQVQWTGSFNLVEGEAMISYEGSAW